MVLIRERLGAVWESGVIGVRCRCWGNPPCPLVRGGCFTRDGSHGLRWWLHAIIRDERRQVEQVGHPARPPPWVHQSIHRLPFASGDGPNIANSSSMIACAVAPRPAAAGPAMQCADIDGLRDVATLLQELIHGWALWPCWPAIKLSPSDIDGGIDQQAGIAVVKDPVHAVPSVMIISLLRPAGHRSALTRSPALPSTRSSARPLVRVPRTGSTGPDGSGLAYCRRCH